jgi:hypothetical protein
MHPQIMSTICTEENMKIKKLLASAILSMASSLAGAALIDLHDGTVQDTTNRLIWLKNWNTNGNHDWDTQMAWAESLEIAGYSDWRIPEVSELHALAAYFRSLPTYVNLLDSLNANFDNVIVNVYWTATSLPTEPARAYDWYVDGSELRNKTEEVFATAVRGQTNVVPEPETYTMLLAGLGMLAFAARRRRQPCIIKEHKMRNRWAVAAKHLATAVLVAWTGFAGNASATLISRGPDLVYDDVLNITWTRNANLPGSSGLGWAGANAWAANLEFAGFDDWRLPTINLTTPTTTTTDCRLVSAADCATNGNELGYMFYQNLAGLAGNTETGTQTAVGGELLTGIQPFYWSSTEFAPGIPLAWVFDFGLGFSGLGSLDSQFLAVWVVRSGDVTAAVPEPQTVALLLAGLGLLGWRTKLR